MTTTQHPLTETAAVEMWDASPCPEGYEFRGMLTVEQDATVYAMRAAFDAGREHEREHAAQDRPAEITDEMVEAALLAEDELSPHAGGSGISGFRLEDERRVRAALTAALTVAAPSAEPLARTLLGVPEGHGAPHHDAGRIKPDDYVAQLDESGFIRAGRAHYQDASDDWHTEDGTVVTWATLRADRPDAITVWPAPTPPAVEVELPGEHPAHLTGVESGGVVCEYMALDQHGYWQGVSRDGVVQEWSPLDLNAATHPEHGPIRRDGEHENGEPRFVKEGEK